jgi:AAA family ATP:ADP antiporter
MFDVRRGELGRTVLMALYLMFVLFAYYILKNVSRAMFLNHFDLNRLPGLWILIAVIGGFLAYFYSTFAARSSLSRAVAWTTGISVACLLASWWLLRFHFWWMIYAFNIWVSLFAIVFVSQGWLVAANVFNPREAKRLYGILGLGAIAGAGFGSYFTKLAVQLTGINNLIFIAALLVALSYAAFLGVAHQTGMSVATARAARDVQSGFSLGDMLSALRHHRHLQVIAGIILVTYMLEVTVDFQFSGIAKSAYPNQERLAAFLGSFTLWMVGVEFVLQFFLTPLLVSRLGVGGTLQIPGMAVGLASLGTLFWPSLGSTTVVRLAEESTRFSFHRTAMELLYLPLPAELKTRTKIFLDIFGDRLARGLGGLMLLLLASVAGFSIRQIAFVAVGLAAASILLSAKARSEYVQTVRRRLEMRRLDIAEVRVSVHDKATLKLLEETVESPHGRQAAYALSLLSEIPGYSLSGLLKRSSTSQSPELRARVYEIALRSGDAELLPQAVGEIQSRDSSAALRPAVAYALAFAPEATGLARRLLEDPSWRVAESVLEAARDRRELIRAVTPAWLEAAAADPRPERRRLAALAAGLHPDGPDVLPALLADPDPSVAERACLSAGLLQERAYVEPLLQRLSEPRVRGAAAKALAAFGPGIVGTLSDVIADENAPVALRRQAPRVLKLIPHQRSVDALLEGLRQGNLEIRTAVLRALNRLRAAAPQLDFGGESLTRHILNDVRHYYELNAALLPFRDRKDRRTAAGLLAQTLEDRLQHTLERLFRLLGLRYPPRAIRAAYRAVQAGGQEHSTAIEFLDNILEHDLKRSLLPLLDAPDRTSGGEPFGIEAKTPETAIRDLIDSGDTWLVACAMAAGAELGYCGLIDAIRSACQNSGVEVGEVGQAAMTSLMRTAMLEQGLA